MTEDFDQLVDRSNTCSNKWDRYRGRDIIPMWVADSDFAVLPEIQEALVARINHPVFGYSHPSPRLQELVVDRLLRFYDWRIEPDWIVWLPGVVPGMHLACRGIGQPEARVFSPSVIYPYFKSTPLRSGRQRVDIPMTWSEQRLVIDLDSLGEQMDANELLLFCNPQNPGGSCYRREELQKLADIVVSRQGYICSDEIHCDLILDEDRHHIPLASLGPEIAARSITLMAPSKNFNIAGLGCAFAVIPDMSLRRAFKLAGHGIVPSVNLLALVATEAAYEYGDEWNRAQCRYLAANRDFLRTRLNDIEGLSVGPVEATFLAWINVGGLGLDDPAGFFEQQAGVGLSAGMDFGNADYLRLNFGCPRSRLEQAVERIRQAII